MSLNINDKAVSFGGITKIYAISDSHQETRKTSAFLSKILRDDRNSQNILFLNCGDIFKGIYPRQLERDCYVKLKEEKPDVEMVMTLGNNDFGFNKESLDFLIDTIKTFASKGIHTVCANIYDVSGSRPKWLKPYAIVNRDGDRTLVTGFCIDNLSTAKYGIIPRKQKEVLGDISEAITREKPDNVVILNHDYMESSREIVQLCRKNGINVDLVIGGHDHEFVQPDKALNIYYPKAFSDSMYKMNLVRCGNEVKVADVEMIENRNLPVNSDFEKELKNYEISSKLLDKIVPRTLNLTKQYSKPSPLGSFLADNMKESSGADAAFISTGFLMKSMPYIKNDYITNYSFKKTLIAETPVKIVELSPKQLKEVFDNALRTNGYGASNPRFLQCSNNIKIEGKNNPSEKRFDVTQIYINNEPLLDKNSNPIKTDRKYKCCIDSFIAEGGQGFKTLQKAEKQDVIKNNEPLKINEIFLDALKTAYKKYPQGSDYPYFTLNEL